jgi:hypothetical protein
VRRHAPLYQRTKNLDVCMCSRGRLTQLSNFTIASPAASKELNQRGALADSGHAITYARQTNQAASARRGKVAAHSSWKLHDSL